MKRMVAIILMLVGFMGLITPECPGPLVSATTTTTQATISASNFAGASLIAASSLEEEKKSSHHNDCDDCGNPNHECHQCHFGHCGFIVHQSKFSPHTAGSQYGQSVENLTLKSFIPSLFRPPIAQFPLLTVLNKKSGLGVFKHAGKPETNNRNTQ